MTTTTKTFDPCRDAPFAECVRERVAIDAAISVAEQAVADAEAAVEAAHQLAHDAAKAAEAGLNADGVRTRVMASEAALQDARIALAGLQKDKRSAEAAWSARAPATEEYLANIARPKLVAIREKKAAAALQLAEAHEEEEALLADFHREIQYVSGHQRGATWYLQPIETLTHINSDFVANAKVYADHVSKLAA